MRLRQSPAHERRYRSATRLSCSILVLLLVFVSVPLSALQPPVESAQPNDHRTADVVKFLAGAAVA